MKTYQPTNKDIERKWHLVDVKGKILGRIATDIALLLMGKNKATFSKHMDMGDNVVVVNADKVELTGRKLQQKSYFRHSGYPGALKEIKFAKLFKEQPEKVIEHAVSGMLPKNKLQQKRMRRLKVFSGDKHPFNNVLKINN